MLFASACCFANAYNTSNGSCTNLWCFQDHLTSVSNIYAGYQNNKSAILRILHTSACSQCIAVDDANHHGTPHCHPEQRPNETAVEDITERETRPKSHGKPQMSRRKHCAQRRWQRAWSRSRARPRLAAVSSSRELALGSNLIFTWTRQTSFLKLLKFFYSYFHHKPCSKTMS